ncbi:hypothetical protein BDR07DRAFT_575478 [Suillus spraguei]|nr:hypothetical protein BDR07DRAFT_575478 [Suillus spraguei]
MYGVLAPWSIRHNFRTYLAFIRSFPNLLPAGDSYAWKELADITRLLYTVSSAPIADQLNASYLPNPSTVRTDVHTVHRGSAGGQIRSVKNSGSHLSKPEDSELQVYPVNRFANSSPYDPPVALHPHCGPVNAPEARASKTAHVPYLMHIIRNRVPPN